MNQSLNRKRVKILSLDGGGIRGIIPGQLLVTLEGKLRARTGNPESRLVNYFDLIAGSGTGGIMACAYLSPLKPHLDTPRFSAAQIVDFYLKHGAKVFNETLDHRIISLGGLLDEKYDADGLESVLRDYFEDLKLSHLLKPCLITSYDISRRKAHFFTSHTASKPAGDFYVRDMARATSAVPTFFECKLVQSLSGVSYPLVDGSVFASNPALCALAEVHKIRQPASASRRVSVPEVLLLSLGTGQPKEQYDYDDARRWGKASWARPLVDIVAAGVAETVDYQIKQLFETAGVPNQYLRINPKLPVDVDDEIDDTRSDNLQALRELGEYVAEENEAALDQFIDLLLA